MGKAQGMALGDTGVTPWGRWGGTGDSTGNPKSKELNWDWSNWAELGWDELSSTGTGQAGLNCDEKN